MIPLCPFCTLGFTTMLVISDGPLQGTATFYDRGYSSPQTEMKGGCWYSTTAVVY